MRWAIVLLAGCGSRADPSPNVAPSPPPQKLVPVDTAQAGCPPLAITLDGAPVPIAAALARNYDGLVEVHLDSAPTLDCDQVMMGGAILADGDVHIVVNTLRDDRAHAVPGVTWDGAIVHDPPPRRETPVPQDAGESVDVCVAPVTLLGKDRFEGRMLAIAGLVHASSCGEAPFR